MKGIPAIWFALIVLAMLALLTVWIDRTVQPPPPKRDGSTRHDPDYIISNFSSMRADSLGNPRYKLEGVEMRHFPDDDSTELLRPVFSQFSAKKPASRVEGERGLVSSNGENVYFMDNVKIVRDATARKGELTVLTEYLHIVPDQDYLQTDQPVTILQAPRTVIHGNSMEYYKKEGLLKLVGRVRVHYERPDAPPAPPLTIERVVGHKVGPAPLPAPDKATVKASPAPKVPAQKVDGSEKAVKKTAKKTTKKAAQKTVTKAGKSKTRIRRRYANQAN